MGARIEFGEMITQLYHIPDPPRDGSPVTAVEIGMGGDWGIHALGAPLFTDRESRLYLFSQTGELFLVLDLADFTLSNILMQGPEVDSVPAGQSGLAGPLTDCETGFVIVV